MELTSNEIDLILTHFPRGLIAFDLETTGLSPFTDRIIEVAAIKVDIHGEVTSFQTLVNPKRTIPKITIDIHGITDKDVKDAPLIQDVLPKFFKFCGDLPLVAHNSKFDAGFLVSAVFAHSLAVPQSRVLDSRSLLKFTFASYPALMSPKNYKLVTLCEFFKIPLINHHRATDDAWACLKVFVKGLEVATQKSTSRRPNFGRPIDFHQYDPHKMSGMPEHLSQLVPKINEHEFIFIKYLRGSYSNQFRPVKLVGVIPIRKGLVLYAHCLMENVPKEFFLKHIQSYKEMNTDELTQWKEKIELH